MSNPTENNYSNVWPAELGHDMRMPQVDDTLKNPGVYSILEDDT
jgi:hypothetical protein